MSLMRIAHGLVCISLTLASGALGQSFSDQGLFSGSGLTLLPTATVAPSSEFRIQYARLSYLRSGGNGSNILTLCSGFSESVEGYARLTGEQFGAPNSEVAYTVGGKFRVPALVPFFGRLALWMEKTQSDAAAPGALLPQDAFRMAAVATLDSNGIHPTALLGFSQFSNESGLLAGVGVTVAAGHDLQLGLEAVHGYLGRKSDQIAGSAAVRVFPNISLHVSPGYITAPAASTWTVSVGISCTTAGIDFHPVIEETNKNTVIVPSIEEIEREIRRPAGADSLRDGAQKPPGKE
jgi:hypothetical protein